ncbi:MAG TPA: hypothetical protein VMW50_08470 [Dehalococcoidia bacterium]|nr:hypothetical protein [Dehalococcoidia bacterium]
MSALDGISALLLGVYLLAVSVKGNSRRLMQLAERDKAFLPWIIALAVLLYLYRIPALKGPVSLLIAAALIAFGMQAGRPFSDKVAALWARLLESDKKMVPGTVESFIPNTGGASGSF